MAKKKLPSVEDAIKSFKEVMHRASLISYFNVNRTLVCRTKEKVLLIIIPDQSLWEKIVDDQELLFKELDITTDDGKESMKYLEETLKYEALEDGWITIGVTEELFSGKVFKIKRNKVEYEIPINRDLMPLKLKKAEYDKLSYRITISKTKPLLFIRKRFDGIIDDYGFTIIRLFKVI
jgi:hypothetical protein